MRSIKRIYHDFDPVANEHWTDIADVLYIGNKTIVHADNTSITFEKIPYLTEDADTVTINAADRSVKLVSFEEYNQLLDINLSELVIMSVAEMVEVIFERMEDIEC